ncbi:MAG: hypothetical protein K2P14_03920 [Anaeroplasmataceae bacterium]|nr:hypothetical protein [Anaeroplasmataceae bacterium]
MSYRIDKANKLQQKISSLQQEIKLNARALEAVSKAKSGKHIVSELQAKDAKLQKKLLKTSKQYYSYLDDNLKISDLSKLNKVSEEEEDPYDYEDYY